MPSSTAKQKYRHVRQRERERERIKKERKKSSSNLTINNAAEMKNNNKKTGISCGDDKERRMEAS